MRRLALTSTAIACVLMLGLHAQERAQGQPGAPETREFINDIAIAGLAEVELGKLAAARASDAEVKAFGQMMVKDHSQANKELAQVASKLNVQLPAKLDQKHQDLADKLSTLKGPDFDREYMAAMVAGHQEVLTKLRTRTEGKAVGTSGDPAEQALNQFATKTLPVVQKHLNRAQELHEKIK